MKNILAAFPHAGIMYIYWQRFMERDLYVRKNMVIFCSKSQSVSCYLTVVFKLVVFMVVWEWTMITKSIWQPSTGQGRPSIVPTVDNILFINNIRNKPVFFIACWSLLFFMRNRKNHENSFQIL